ncbi:MAG: hypothetical protein VYA84_02855, partial [Planctomycetota bacterium]|nr:hypothetical protein [Planctomycetota bacterium]
PTKSPISQIDRVIFLVFVVRQILVILKHRVVADLMNETERVNPVFLRHAIAVRVGGVCVEISF